MSLSRLLHKPVGRPPHKPGYRVEEWEDETNMYDPKGYWCGGIECYQRTYRCYVPIRLNPDNLGVWLDKNEGNVVWIDAEGNPVPTWDERMMENELEANQ